MPWQPVIVIHSVCMTGWLHKNVRFIRGPTTNSIMEGSKEGQAVEMMTQWKITGEFALISLELRCVILQGRSGFTARQSCHTTGVTCQAITKQPPCGVVVLGFLNTRTSRIEENRIPKNPGDCHSILKPCEFFPSCLVFFWLTIACFSLEHSHIGHG